MRSLPCRFRGGAGCAVAIAVLVLIPGWCAVLVHQRIAIVVGAIAAVVAGKPRVAPIPRERIAGGVGGWGVGAIGVVGHKAQWCHTGCGAECSRRVAESVAVAITEVHYTAARAVGAGGRRIVAVSGGHRFPWVRTIAVVRKNCGARSDAVPISVNEAGHGICTAAILVDAIVGNLESCGSRSTSGFDSERAG
jgi:hypothetical protein